MVSKGAHLFDITRLARTHATQAPNGWWLIKIQAYQKGWGHWGPSTSRRWPVGAVGWSILPFLWSKLEGGGHLTGDGRVQRGLGIVARQCSATSTITIRVTIMIIIYILYIYKHYININMYIMIMIIMKTKTIIVMVILILCKYQLLIAITTTTTATTTTSSSSSSSSPGTEAQAHCTPENVSGLTQTPLVLNCRIPEGRSAAQPTTTWCARSMAALMGKKRIQIDK